MPYMIEYQARFDDPAYNLSPRTWTTCFERNPEHVTSESRSFNGRVDHDRRCLVWDDLSDANRAHESMTHSSQSCEYRIIDLDLRARYGGTGIVPEPESEPDRWVILYTFRDQLVVAGDVEWSRTGRITPEYLHSSREVAEAYRDDCWGRSHRPDQFEIVTEREAPALLQREPTSGDQPPICSECNTPEIHMDLITENYLCDHLADQTEANGGLVKRVTPAQ